VNSVDSSQYLTEKSESGDEHNATEDQGKLEESEQGTGNGVEFSPESVPAYSGNPSAEINGNVPYFRDSELTATAFKRFPELDELGRCGVVTACLGPETMPVAARESIGMIKPSGWHLEKYEGIDGNYLYNRCHLIGYQLCGENANELNLITGTRYMNTEGMEPYESDTAYYIRRTGNHVLYRVTPVFNGDDLVATGVLMEARSVEDDDFAYCVFCYNVQPGIEIDYATGDSSPAVQDDRSPEAAGRDEEKQTAESDHTL
jgi:DNA-entry nuclease